MNDLETDVLLSRLCTRVLKRRMDVYGKKEKVEVKEAGFAVCGYWVEKTFRVEVEKG